MTGKEFLALPLKDKMKAFATHLRIPPDKELAIVPKETATHNTPKSKAKYRILSPRTTSPKDIERIAASITINNTPPYQKAFRYLQYKQHPIYTFIVKSEELYALLSGPLNKFPTHEKHFLGRSIKESIQLILTYAISIGRIQSTAPERIKQISSELAKLTSSFNLGYRMSFFSVEFHSKISNFILDLNLNLDLIHELITTQKKIDRNELTIPVEQILFNHK